MTWHWFIGQMHFGSSGPGIFVVSCSSTSHFSWPAVWQEVRSLRHVEMVQPAIDSEAPLNHQFTPSQAICTRQDSERRLGKLQPIFPLFARNSYIRVETSVLTDNCCALLLSSTEQADTCGNVSGLYLAEGSLQSPLAHRLFRVSSVLQVNITTQPSWFFIH
jgi:hypothetical protein